MKIRPHALCFPFNGVNDSGSFPDAYSDRSEKKEKDCWESYQAAPADPQRTIVTSILVIMLMRSRNMSPSKLTINQGADSGKTKKFR
jgi:hypothetical protein